MSAARVRLFVALELPEDVREAVARWRGDAIGGAEGVRTVSRDDLHVTLCFLGWQEAGDVDAIADACAVVRGRGPVALLVGEAVLLPRRRPRVLAVSLEDPDGALAALQGTLSAALEGGGWYEAEQRPYYGHVTVARAGRGARIPRSALLAPAPSPLSFSGRRVVLYRSQLRRSGASYRPLSKISLAGRSG